MSIFKKHQEIELDDENVVVEPSVKYRTQKRYLSLWERTKICFGKNMCTDVLVEVFKEGEEEEASSIHFTKEPFFALFLQQYLEDDLVISSIHLLDGTKYCPNNTEIKRFKVYKPELTFSERFKILFQYDPLMKVDVCLGKYWDDVVNGYTYVPLSRILHNYCFSFPPEKDIFDKPKYWNQHRRRKCLFLSNIY